MSAPTIVVAAYARPESLHRLLASLERAQVLGSVDVVISIDGGADRHDEVRSVAHAFRWKHGTIEIIEHDHLGLVDHFHFCGDLTARFGSVVLLEDDLVVGPHFLQWATEALTVGEAEQRVAGVCLSAPWFDGYRKLPFEPVIDGSDGFFARVPWFHGMAWTENMWAGYRSGVDAAAAADLHGLFDQLDPDEWFPNAVRYLVANSLYYLFPRAAQATNTGAAGTHFSEASDFFQVPLSMGAPRTFEILALDRALGVYDDHLELEPAALARLVPELAEVDLTSDLLGVRDLSRIETEFVLTIRPTRAAQQQWGAHFRPLVVNVALGTEGNEISLCRVRDVLTGRRAERTTAARLQSFADRGRTPGLRTLSERLVNEISSRTDRRGI